MLFAKFLRTPFLIEHVSGGYFLTSAQTMKTVKVTGCFAIFKTIYHNGIYLLLFGNRKLQSFEISCE